MGRPYELINGENKFDSIITLSYIDSVDPISGERNRIIGLPFYDRKSQFDDPKLSNFSVGNYFKRNLFERSSNYRLFVQSTELGKRFLVTNGITLLDTIADEFVSYDVQREEGLLRYGDNFYSVKTSERKKRLYKSFIFETKMYSSIVKDSVYLRDINDDVICRFQLDKSGFGGNGYVNSTQIRPYGERKVLIKLENNRYMFCSDNHFIILDKNGKLLDEFESGFNLFITSTHFSKGANKNLIMFCHNERGGIYGVKTPHPQEREFLYDFIKLVEYRK